MVQWVKHSALKESRNMIRLNENDSVKTLYKDNIDRWYWERAPVKFTTGMDE